MFFLLVISISEGCSNDCLYHLCFCNLRIVGFISKRKNSDVNVLLTVNAIATCNAGISLNESAIFFRTPKNGNIIITPTILKTDADHATNFDKDENFKLTSSAVEVVPILAPITIGIATSISIVPCESKTMTNPTTTELD